MNKTNIAKVILGLIVVGLIIMNADTSTTSKPATDYDEAKASFDQTDKMVNSVKQTLNMAYYNRCKAETLYNLESLKAFELKQVTFKPEDISAFKLKLATLECKEPAAPVGTTTKDFTSPLKK